MDEKGCWVLVHLNSRTQSTHTYTHRQKPGVITYLQLYITPAAQNVITQYPINDLAQQTETLIVNTADNGRTHTREKLQQSKG